MPFDSAGYVETQNTTLGLLERSLELLTTHGWIKGSLVDIGGYCAIGAVFHSSINPVSQRDRSMRAEAATYLYRALPWWYRLHQRWANPHMIPAESCVVKYNDATWRKFEDISGLYERAIARCRADQNKAYR